MDFRRRCRRKSYGSGSNTWPRNWHIHRPIEAHINDYAYTNEQEYFAVLAEYFFTSPEVLRGKDPRLYQIMRRLFHQDAPRRSTGFRQSADGTVAMHRVRAAAGKIIKNCCLHHANAPTKAESTGYSRTRTPNVEWPLTATYGRIFVGAQLDEPASPLRRCDHMETSE